MEYILCLQSIEQSDIALAGGKAANLGVLIQADLPVPPEVIGADGQPVVEAEKESTVLEGIAVSGGRARGIARIVFDPREAARLHAGEILVTQATDPGWTPVFPLVSGLVLEIGGQLSHGAIVAREYGIPAVLNVQGAMHRIRDGQVIIVDGDTGKVFMDE
ncbi:MAG TPA: PEP-utilizing enzyme [Ktedonobacteraceae bacterium]|nr:PEP-utilizing enzyme [Ktedonobacteraceae bacterium]